MANREGVIKFTLDFTAESCLEPDMITGINGWRHILHRLQLIGQDPARYMGYGFGNISMRSALRPGSFLISGTQTGKFPFLKPSEYALVTDCDPMMNHISARGEIRPSSEAMTHGQLYGLDASIQCVVHAHSPEIWQQAEELRLPLARRTIAYGTPEMALEVARLFRETSVRERKIFAMAGHEDGVVSFGRGFNEACTIMIDALAHAVMQIDPSRLSL